MSAHMRERMIGLMKSADIKILFQEEVEMMPTSLARSAEEDNVRYKNSSLQKEAQAQQVIFLFCVLDGRYGAGDLAGGLVLKF